MRALSRNTRRVTALTLAAALVIEIGRASCRERV